MNVRALKKVLQRYNRNGLIVSPSSEVASVLPSEEDIRRGLDLGEFLAYYQPKFVLSSGDGAGAEVLVRWQLPVRGPLLPKDFLAAVLAYDLIDEMFKQLLEQGLSLLSVLYRSNHSLGLAFNLHASQLQGNGLTERYLSLAQAFCLAGIRLDFRIGRKWLAGG